MIRSAHDLAGAHLVHAAPFTTFGFAVAVVFLRTRRLEEAKIEMGHLELIDLFANKPHINHARCFEPIGNPLLLCALVCAICLLALAPVLDLLTL